VTGPKDRPNSDGNPAGSPSTGVVTQDQADLARVLTENAQLKAQFLQAQKMEAVGRLASGVAHDFKNVLTLIAGYADQLLAEADTPAIREPLTEIRAATERAIGLAEQLLTFSRRGAAVQSPVSVNVVLAEPGKMLARMLPANVELTIRQDPALGLVMANAGQLHQVLLNLVVNARDAMPSGGRLVIDAANVDVEPGSPDAESGARTGPTVRVTVADTGVGMDEDTRRRALEPFFTTKEGPVGTGLGLSTVHSIVTDCRGRIVIDSAPGIGTTVRIYLPRLEAGRPETDAEPAARPGAQPRARRILVVDEDAAVRRLLVDLLAAAGYEVEAVAAVDRASPSETWDLAVVDLVTLERTGAFRRPFAGGKPLKLLGVSSASAAPGRSFDGIPIGATLAKPIAPRQLLRAVRDMLEAD